MNYHDPVLLQESIDGLDIKNDGTYVDATYGGGGHARMILKKLDANGHLYGFDQDEDVLVNLTENERFTFLNYNFRYLQRVLRLHSVDQVDGILADLGVSSHQINQADRGFSFRYDAMLDMRMNRETEFTAADLLNTYSAEKIQLILSKYGEVRNAKTLAETIVAERAKKPIQTTADFLLIMNPLVRGNRNRYLAQVFQALRIEVNDEMGALEDFMKGCLEVLKPGGRLVVISYHSLEDRMIKNFFRAGNAEGEVDKDFYGNISRPFKAITKKTILPTEEEIRINPRARSAKMRIGIRSKGE